MYYHTVHVETKNVQSYTYHSWLDSEATYNSFHAHLNEIVVMHVFTTTELDR